VIIIISIIRSTYDEIEFALDFETLYHAFIVSFVAALIGLIIGLLIPFLLYHPKRNQILFGSEVFMSSLLTLILIYFSTKNTNPEIENLEQSSSMIVNNQMTLNGVLSEYETGYRQASKYEQTELTYSIQRAFSLLVDSLSRHGDTFFYDRIQIDRNSVTYFHKDDSVYYRSLNTDNKSVGVFKLDSVSTIKLPERLRSVLHEPTQNSGASLTLIGQ
jgi:hypothetical protein